MKKYTPEQIAIHLIGPMGGSNKLFTLPLGKEGDVRGFPLDIELDGDMPLVLSYDWARGLVINRVEDGLVQEVFSITDLPANLWVPGFAFVGDEFHISCWEILEQPRSRHPRSWLRRYDTKGNLQGEDGSCCRSCESIRNR